MIEYSNNPSTFSPMPRLIQAIKLQHILLLLIIAAVTMLRLRLLGVPLERDEGEYAYMGQLILKGIPPYQAAYNMKFPGIYFLYALVIAIFGHTHTAIHTGLLILNIISILLLYFIGKDILNYWVGIVAGASYAMLSLSYRAEGLWANAEHFIVPFALAGFLMLRKALNNDRLSLFLVSGLLFGLATLVKQHGAFYAASGFVIVIGSFYRVDKPYRTKALKAFSLFSAAVLAPLVLMVFYLWYSGVFERFYFWAFTYTREYSTQLSLSEAPAFFFSTFPPLVKSTILIWIIAGIGLVAILFSPQYRKEKLFVLALCIGAFLATTPGFYFRRHYFVLFLPAVALCAGLGSFYLLTLFSSARNNFLKLFPPVAATVITLVSPLASHADVLFSFSPEHVARVAYGVEPFPEALYVSQFIQQYTSPTDTVAIVGNEPEILFYSQRRSATGYMYIYSLFEDNDYAPQMQAEMRREIESAHARLLLRTHLQPSWYSKTDAERQLDLWFAGYANTYYTLIARLEYTPGGNKAELVTDKELLNKNPNHDYWISIFERK